MPFKLIDSNSAGEVILDTLEFIDTEELKYFQARNSTNPDKGINIVYIPKITSKWDKERFELILFENPYLNAENDVFEVYEQTLNNERLGWIFPITMLDSNDNDFADVKNLNNYKFITYQKLLELNKSIPIGTNSGEYYKLSDIFKDTIACVLSKETMNKIHGFNMNNYVLSFYKYGYLHMGGIQKSKKMYDRYDFVTKMRSNRRRVNIVKSNYDVSRDDFTNLLFKEHLLQSESYLIRFTFLYQIIEQFMESEFDRQFHQHIDDYQKNKLAKNDFRENIINSSKERQLIHAVIDKVAIQESLKNEFTQECNNLFAEMGVDTKDNLPDKIYDFRNLITHRLRSLATKSTVLEKITEIFEMIIIDLLINYK